MTSSEGIEARLYEAEDRFNKMLRLIPDAVGITRLRDGLFLGINEAFEEITGFSREEIIGRTSEELSLWSPDDRNRLVERMQQDGCIHNMPVDFQTKSGAVVHCNLSAEPITLGGEPCLISMVRDVTERARTQEALRVSQEKFEKAFRVSPDSVTISRLSDGLFVDVNEGFERISGYTREESVGTLSVDLKLWLPGERERMVEMLKREGRVRHMEVDFQTRYQGPRRCTLDAEIIELDGEQYLVAVSRDITEQNRALRALQASEEKFSKAFHASPDASMITTLPDGIILDVNEGFTKIVGYQPDEVIGQAVPDLKIWVNLEDRNRMMALLEQDGQFKGMEARLCLRSGEERDCLVSGAIIQLEGQPCLFSVAQDITVQKQAEETVRKFNAELEARVAERTAQLAAANKELEAFSYSVSHDLRAPLRAITGFSQILLKSYAPEMDETGQRYLSYLSEAAERLNTHINDLLELSRITRREMRHVLIDLSALAEEVVADLRQTGPDRNVKVDIAPSVMGRGDPSLLRVVMANLLENAWKYSRGCEEACIAFGQQERRGQPAYFVQDNGVGFNMNYADKLFQAFQRLHAEDEFEGSGIGLATVQRIIYRHGGEVWAEAVEGEGATFYFTLSGLLKRET